MKQRLLSFANSAKVLAMKCFFDLLTLTFVLSCAGAFGCGRGPDVPVDARTPQEMLANVHVAVTPSTSDGSMLHNPAPQSGLVSTGTVPHAFGVKAEVFDAYYYDRKTGTPYAPAGATAFQINANGTTATVSAVAQSPLIYKLRFTPTYTGADGTIYEGEAAVQPVCIGD